MFAFFAYRAMRYQARFPLIARHALLLTMLAIIVYGASDEFHLRFVPGHPRRPQECRLIFRPRLTTFPD